MNVLKTILGYFVIERGYVAVIFRSENRDTPFPKLIRLVHYTPPGQLEREGNCRISYGILVFIKPSYSQVIFLFLTRGIYYHLAFSFFLSLVVR